MASWKKLERETLVAANTKLVSVRPLSGLTATISLVPILFVMSMHTISNAHCLTFPQGGALPETNEIVTLICSCHNFFSLSSVQILFIPACCLLCVL